MKYIIITILLALQITTYAQENKEFKFQTEKETYKIGELVTSTLKSKKSFGLSTTGDCNAGLLPPSFIKQIDGKWNEPEAVMQMCCGLPCTMNIIKKMNPQVTVTVVGTYKMIVHTCSGIVVSNAFEVL
ncbi:MAG: hypothetical protein ACI94Y_002584 [Maribacter sp.]|jgi:hypothetical protein